jgi:hypothetical protein
MWDNAKRQRYNHLRTCEWEGVLTEAEQTELAAMTQELYDAEAVYLLPATVRLQHDTAQLRTRLERVQERNRQLEALMRRKEALLARIDAFVAEAEAEQEALQRAYQAIMVGSASEGDAEVVC